MRRNYKTTSSSIWSHSTRRRILMEVDRVWLYLIWLEMANPSSFQTSPPPWQESWHKSTLKTSSTQILSNDFLPWNPKVKSTSLLLTNLILLVKEQNAKTIWFLPCVFYVESQIRKRVHCGLQATTIITWLNWHCQLSRTKGIWRTKNENLLL